MSMLQQQIDHPKMESIVFLTETNVPITLGGNDHSAMLQLMVYSHAGAAALTITKKFFGIKPFQVDSTDHGMENVRQRSSFITVSGKGGACASVRGKAKN